MNSPAVRTKTLFAILFGLPLLLAGIISLAVFQVGRFGDLEVAVHGKDEGCNVRVRIPALVVPVAVQVARCAVPDIAWKLRHEAGVPSAVARDVIEALADAPDGVLVEMRNGDEIVVIEKRGGRVLVEIDTPDETVHAAVPIGAARSLLGVI